VAAALRAIEWLAGKQLGQAFRKALRADSPALRALPAQRLQQARQALRAIQFTEALAGVLVVAATTQQLTAVLAVLVDKAAAAAAAAG
jgi:hypothetical protein